MSEKYSDVIIVGTDLAGLIAGAFLAKRGLSVTVLNFERDVASQKKNIQPNLITNLESRLFKNILGRLSILDHELQIIRKLEVPFQVVLPKHRIDVFRDRDRLQGEIQREFPMDSNSVKSFYEDMDHFEAKLDTEKLQELILPNGIKNRWRFGQFVKQTGLNQRVNRVTDTLGFNHEVRALLESQLKFLSQTHSNNPFTYQIAKTLSADNCLLYEVKGGIGHLKKIFLNKIEQYNGRIKNEVQIESFQFENRSLASIKLGGFEGGLGCRYLLWNDEIRKLAPFLPRKWRTRRLIKNIESIQPKFYHFSIQYQLDTSVVPVGMRENLLFIGDPEKDLYGENFLHLNLFYPAADENQVDQSFLTVSYLLPADQITQSAEHFEQLHEAIFQKISRLIPFSKNKIQLRFPLSHREADSDGTLFPMEKTDFEIFRENAQENPVYHLAPESFAELFPMSNRTPYKNLHLTSPEILATLGSEGKFLLGLKTIDLIWSEVEHSKKKAVKQRKIA